jgi:hypothetical protein
MRHLPGWPAWPGPYADLHAVDCCTLWHGLFSCSEPEFEPRAMCVQHKAFIMVFQQHTKLLTPSKWLQLGHRSYPTEFTHAMPCLQPTVHCFTTALSHVSGPLHCLSPCHPPQLLRPWVSRPCHWQCCHPSQRATQTRPHLP